MNWTALRLAGALLALVAAGFVLAVTAVGLVGLAVAVLHTDPWTQGRMVGAGLLTAGLMLLLVAYLLDRRSLHCAVTGSRSVVSHLVTTVVSAGQR